jgi:hypothetical protein
MSDLDPLTFFCFCLRINCAGFDLLTGLVAGRGMGADGSGVGRIGAGFTHEPAANTTGNKVSRSTNEI